MTDSQNSTIPELRILDKSVTRQLHAGQLIVDAAAVVKELVENAVDAGATNISVNVDKNCLNLTIKDNGCGIPSIGDCRQLVGHAHCTSKIAKFDDIYETKTYGFRGEALHLIAVSSQSVDIVTRTADESVGARIRFENGKRLDQITPAASPCGTSIAVKGLFANMPVRLKQHKKNTSKIMQRISKVLYDFGLIHPKLRVISSRPYVRKMPGTSLKDSIIEMFSRTTFEQLIPIDFQCSSVPPPPPPPSPSAAATVDCKHTIKALLHDTRPVEECNQVHVNGWLLSPRGDVSLPGLARTGSSDRMFIFVNGRVAEMSLLQKPVTHLFRKAYQLHLDLTKTNRSALNCSRRYPFCVIQMTLPANLLDVNLSPHKTEFLFRNVSHVQTIVGAAVTSAIAAILPRFDPEAPRSSLSTPNARVDSISIEEASAAGTAAASSFSSPEVPRSLSASISDEVPSSVPDESVGIAASQAQVSGMLGIGETPPSVLTADQHNTRISTSGAVADSKTTTAPHQFQSPLLPSSSSSSSSPHPASAASAASDVVPMLSKSSSDASAQLEPLRRNGWLGPPLRKGLPTQQALRAFSLTPESDDSDPEPLRAVENSSLHPALDQQGGQSSSHASTPLNRKRKPTDQAQQLMSSFMHHSRPSSTSNNVSTPTQPPASKRVRTSESDDMKQTTLDTICTTPQQLNHADARDDTDVNLDSDDDLYEEWYAQNTDTTTAQITQQFQNRSNATASTYAACAQDDSWRMRVIGRLTIRHQSLPPALYCCSVRPRSSSSTSDTVTDIANSLYLMNHKLAEMESVAVSMARNLQVVRTALDHAIPIDDTFTFLSAYMRQQFERLLDTDSVGKLLLKNGFVCRKRASSVLQKDVVELCEVPQETSISVKDFVILVKNIVAALSGTVPDSPPPPPPQLIETALSAIPRPPRVMALIAKETKRIVMQTSSSNDTNNHGYPPTRHEFIRMMQQLGPSFVMANKISLDQTSGVVNWPAVLAMRIVNE
jgi:DNA mismatch repair protein MutL